MIRFNKGLRRVISKLNLVAFLKKCDHILLCSFLFCLQMILSDALPSSYWPSYISVSEFFSNQHEFTIHKYMWTFLKMPSYPGSAHRKFSVSLPESRWALDGQLLLGDSEVREGPERQEKPILMIFHTVRSIWHFNGENVWCEPEYAGVHFMFNEIWEGVNYLLNQWVSVQKLQRQTTTICVWEKNVRGNPSCKKPTRKLKLHHFALIIYVDQWSSSF